MRYEIRVEGVLDARWSEWFDGMTVASEPAGRTLIAGTVTDQAALHSVLAKIRDLGLTLISVQQVNVTTGGTD